MSEYWKSIPRKYCEFCKVWFQDNKSSVEFHERGLKHQGNVRRHLSEVRKKGAQKEREQNHMDAEMRKIEHAAMVAYEKDLILSGKAPIKRPVKTEEDDSKLDESNRFGEIRSLMADKAKEEALEKITKKMSKRIEWYESKTVEGKVYYYNRVTCG